MKPIAKVAPAIESRDLDQWGGSPEQDSCHGLVQRIAAEESSSKESQIRALCHESNAVRLLVHLKWNRLNVVRQANSELLGDRKAVDDLTETLDHIVIDRTEEMRRTAEAISRMAARVPVLAFVNNHYAGYAIETARIFRQMIDELGSESPF